jgi:hypothetical protein
MLAEILLLPNAARLISSTAASNAWCLKNHEPI